MTLRIRSAFPLLLVVAIGLSVATADEPPAAGSNVNATTEAQLPPAVLKAIRTATFEVVLKKPETETVKYDRPLPLDLLPFSIRNDKYESIGTAFAIAPGRFVTAAHVTNVASGSQWGFPAIRDAQGNVYPIDKVVKFSLHEDFIVFTAKGAPAVTPLPTSTTYEFDTPVHAVGNALGQGVITRDGALTSETPEDEDGRWKWLRFSAPASPGNSGGPLLDAQGRVIGLISRKSPNENLNFALPIARVIDAPDRASIDSRFTAALTFLTQRKPGQMKASFDLPLPLAEFDRKLIDLTNQFGEEALKKILQESSAELYPRGKSALLLAEPFMGSRPAFVAQQQDGHWDIPRNPTGTGAQLGANGYVWVNPQIGTVVFHVHEPSEVDVQGSRNDSQLLGEQLLKALPMNRVIGSERVRVVSMGSAYQSEDYRDAEGRVWQLRRYRMLHSDSTLLVMTLPLPDGYAGFASATREAPLARVVTELKMMTDYFQTPYEGSLPRWRAFLAETKLRPEAFARWQATLDPKGDVSLGLPRVSVTVDKNVLALTDQSLLIVHPGMLVEGDRSAWDVLGLQFSLEPVKSASLLVIRRAHPADEAGEGPNRRWNNMVQAAGRYTGKPLRDAQAFWVAQVAPPNGGSVSADAKFLYDVSYVTPMVNVQGEVPRAAEHLLQMVSVREN